jgi:hypothetical protein
MQLFHRRRRILQPSRHRPDPDAPCGRAPAPPCGHGWHASPLGAQARHSGFAAIIVVGVLLGHHCHRNSRASAAHRHVSAMDSGAPKSAAPAGRLPTDMGFLLPQIWAALKYLLQMLSRKLFENVNSLFAKAVLPWPASPLRITSLVLWAKMVGISVASSLVST